MSIDSVQQNFYQNYQLSITKYGEFSDNLLEKSQSLDQRINECILELMNTSKEFISFFKFVCAGMPPNLKSSNSVRGFSNEYIERGYIDLQPVIHQIAKDAEEMYDDASKFREGKKFEDNREYEKADAVFKQIKHDKVVKWVKDVKNKRENKIEKIDYKTLKEILIKEDFIHKSGEEIFELLSPISKKMMNDMSIKEVDKMCKAAVEDAFKHPQDLYIQHIYFFLKSVIDKKFELEPLEQAKTNLLNKLQKTIENFEEQEVKNKNLLEQAAKQAAKEEAEEEKEEKSNPNSSTYETQKRESSSSSDQNTVTNNTNNQTKRCIVS